MKLAKSQALLGEEILRADMPQDAAETKDEDYSQDDEYFSEQEAELRTEEFDEQGVTEGKRVRRKPVWAKDYIFSVCRLDMPNLKTTERKYQWCHSCREMVPKETFSNHLLLCAKNRKSCDECGGTFMKMSYLLKHKRNIHGLKGSTTKSDEKQESSEVKQVVESEEKVTWDKDPDIVLGEEDDSELFEGRVVRKGCNPKPVCAPKKRKVETVTREQVESEKVEKQEVSVNTRQEEIGTMKDILITEQKKTNSKKEEPNIIQEESQSEAVSSVSVDRKAENQVVVQIDINKRKTLSQETTVTMNGEKVYSLFNTVKIGDT